MAIIKSDNPGRLEIEEIPIGTGSEKGVKLTVSNPDYSVFVAMTDKEAMGVGESLCKHAYHAGTGLDRDGRVILGNHTKQKLLTRVTLYLKNHEKAQNGFKANTILDMMLSELL